MEDSKRDEGLAEKMKYVQPELISLDKDNGAEGEVPCGNGSGAGDCGAGASPGK